MSEGITRRKLVGGAAAGAAGLALGGAPGTAGAGTTRRADVVVIGAGIAGLAAARKVAAAHRSVVLLEARDRVGGRTLNHPLPGGGVVEIGGQWVGPTQHRILALIKELGLRTYKTYNRGENVLYQGKGLLGSGLNKRQTYTGTIPPVDPAGLAEIALALGELDDMASHLPPGAPWEAARAAEWDGQTLETWKLANLKTPSGRFLIDLGAEAVFATEPRDLSLLHVLFYIRAAGSFENLINTAGGAQESRIVGGSQRISLKMAKRLGSRIVLGAPVGRIERDGNGVRVHSTRGTWSARRAIVALPPALCAHIAFDPDPPALRDQLTQRFPMGAVIKCMAVYDEPFWRADGLTGMATSDTGPVKVTFDNTPPNGRPGILLGFIEGQEARTWAPRTMRQRRAAVLDCFARYFGANAKSGVRDYFDKAWARDPWSRGCYGGYTPPGVLLGFGKAIRAPVGPIHWAGTETATVWNGYMDGAIQSGERAAAEVLAKL